LQEARRMLWMDPALLVVAMLKAWRDREFVLAAG
jgi:hypothetical protein